MSVLEYANLCPPELSPKLDSIVFTSASKSLIALVLFKVSLLIKLSLSNIFWSKTLISSVMLSITLFSVLNK